MNFLSELTVLPLSHRLTEPLTPDMRSPLWVVGQGYLRESQNIGYCCYPWLPPKGSTISLLLRTPCTLDTRPEDLIQGSNLKASCLRTSIDGTRIKVPTLFLCLAAIRSCISFSYAELWKLKLLQPSCFPYHEGRKPSETVNQINLPSQVVLSVKWKK